MAGRAGRSSWGLPPLLAVLALALAAVTAVVLPAGAARADEGDLVVDLTDLSPAVVRTDEQVTVSGRLVNTTEQAMPDPRVRLIMQRHVPASADALAAWLDGSSTLNVTPLTGWAAAGETIPPGGSVPFSLEIDTTGTFSTYSAWGPRGVEVQATAGGEEAAGRSTLIWYPTDEPIEAPAELTMLVPLTPTPAEWRTAVDEAIPVGEAAAERLLAVLDAVGPDASLAVDPVLLESLPPGLDVAADPPTVDGEPASVQAELVERLARPDSRRDLISLGYADADLGALVQHGGAATLWEDAVDRGHELFDAAGLVVEDVAWPAGRISDGVLALLAGSGTEAVVLDADDVTTTEATSARVSVATENAQVDALLADTALGAAVTTATVTGTPARQATLALSAVLTRALPASPAGALVVLPRDVGAAGASSLAELTTRVDALRDAPWVEMTNLRSLLGRTDPGGVGLQIPAADAGPESLTRAEVQQLLDGAAVVDAYTDAAGPTIRARYQPPLLMALSTTHERDARLRSTMLAGAEAGTAALASGISVEAGSGVLLVSGAGNMPVTIANDLDVDAQVAIQLVPAQSLLQVPEIPEYVIPAGSSRTVRIPITAVANGDVDVAVRVLTEAAGAELAAPASFSVRVRADWENIGTGVVAGLLLVAFVVGLVRTIRRGGRRARVTP